MNIQKLARLVKYYKNKELKIIKEGFKVFVFIRPIYQQFLLHELSEDESKKFDASFRTVQNTKEVKTGVNLINYIK